MDPNHTHALDGMIIRMIKAQRDGQEQFEIWGSGSPKREWIYVEDFCNLLIEGANRGIKIYPLNMAQGRGHSIRESAEIIKSKLQYEGELFFNTEYADGDPVKVLDDTEFRKEFPSYTFWDHDKAIEKTIRYYKEVL
jgi:GDP-L-fucose synthase